MLGSSTIPSNGNGRGMNKNLLDVNSLDFGLIGVFIYVKSYGRSINGDKDGMNNGGGELGDYREEFARRQPPLD